MIRSGSHFESKRIIDPARELVRDAASHWGHDGRKEVVRAVDIGSQPEHLRACSWLEILTLRIAQIGRGLGSQRFRVFPWHFLTRHADIGGHDCFLELLLFLFDLPLAFLVMSSHMK